ncbi:MAG: serine/threonine-protein kinase, partial [Gammaproteobacteria bacterium]
SMEFFDSHPLGAEVVDRKPVPLKRALGFATDIATGMCEAHKVGIVHRDLKPPNILINDDDLLKIVDFGVAAAQSSGDTQLTKTGYVIGSLKYMAPEQILGKKVDHTADIYSLGVILYEMATGAPPFSEGDHMAVMYAHVQGNADAPHSRNPDLPAEVSAAIQKAMSRQQEDRFQSMEEFQTVLKSLSEQFGAA